MDDIVEPNAKVIEVTFPRETVELDLEMPGDLEEAGRMLLIPRKPVQQLDDADIAASGSDIDFESVDARAIADGAGDPGISMVADDPPSAFLRLRAPNRTV